jgi:hexosaminidase
MKLLKLSVLMSAMVSFGAFASPSLIPQAMEMKETGGTFNLQPGAVILYSGISARPPAELLAAQLRPATGFKLPVRKKRFFRRKKNNIVFQTSDDVSLGREGYELRVANYVSIKAPAPAGLFYGSQTLRQLLPPEIHSQEKQSVDWQTPTVEIRDFPRFEWRGLMIDVGRYFMPKEDVLKFIDTMASLKYNTFHWHLTEDQGWRIEIKKYPRLTEVGAWRDATLIGHNRANKENPKYDGIRHGGFYTQDDIREVVAYAAERHITIVPEIDMPGHMQAAIAAYPELGCTDEPVAVKKGWGASQTILNPEESTVQFCKDVLTEVMELFPSEFIHIGGDEARKEHWENNERIQQLREERGLADMHEMQSWFIKQIDDFLVANNRRLIGWDEIAEGGLAQNAAVMWWRGKQGREGTVIAKKAAQDGHDIVVASNSHLYFDYYQSKDKKNEPLAIGGYLPLKMVYNFDPIIEGLSKKEAGRLLGAQGQLWREYIPDTELLEYMAFPRACALAELTWISEEHKNYDTFLERMGIQEQRFDAAKVNYKEIEQ